MSRYEYKIVKMDEPSRPKGVLEGRSAAYVQAMSEHINNLAQSGWEYLRSDTLTTQRTSVMGRVEETLSVLVFRRPTKAALPAKDEASKGDDGKSVINVAFKRNRH